MHITGRCHCGQVTYEADVEPDAVSICHCTDCQKLTGSPFRVTVRTRRENVRLTGAEPSLYTKLADSGRPRLQYFCGNCGSPMFVTGEGEQAQRWGIRWGSIDDRERFVPQRQIWRRSAVGWLGAIDDLPAHEQE